MRRCPLTQALLWGWRACRKFDRLTVEQFQAHKMDMYYKDIFHTLINVRRSLPKPPPPAASMHTPWLAQVLLPGH